MYNIGILGETPCIEESSPVFNTLGDTRNHRIVVIRLDTGALVRTIGRDGVGDGQFKRPRGVTALQPPGSDRIAVSDVSLQDACTMS